MTFQKQRSPSCYFCAKGFTPSKRFEWVAATDTVTLRGEDYSVCAYHAKHTPALPKEQDDETVHARNPYGTEQAANDDEDAPVATDGSKHSEEFLKKRQWFRDWHRLNPHVFERFCELADEARSVADKSSAWLIIGGMRWDHFLKTKGSEWKLPNDAIAFLSRAYMASRPDRSGFFDIKTMDGEDFADTRRRCGLDRNEAA